MRRREGLTPVQSYLGDQDVLRLDVPVETVVEVTEVDGLQGLPDDTLHSRRVQLSASQEISETADNSAVSDISCSCRPETASQSANL